MSAAAKTAWLVLGIAAAVPLIVGSLFIVAEAIFPAGRGMWAGFAAGFAFLWVIVYWACSP
jgi:hypothetical protein